MARKSLHIRESLMASGKDEFLTNGYEKASLRTICRKAGLTTGAFYNHFSGKEELFTTLVEPMLSGFQQMYTEVISHQISDLSTGVENELMAISYAIRYKDEFKLLFDCSKGTKYEYFKEHLIHDYFYPSYQAVFDAYAGRPVDSNLVLLIVRLKFKEYMELIYGDFTMEEVKTLITQMTICWEAGFQQLLEEVNKENNT